MNLYDEAAARRINYFELKKKSLLKLANTRICNVSVIIPVNGRTEFNRVVSSHFLRAIHKAPSIKVSLTIVEHSETPEHRDICYDWVNYIHIPQEGHRFNKCLCFNMGALYSNEAMFYLFHDVDTLVPEDFFIKLFQNLKGYTALQAFTGRRLLYFTQHLTTQVMAGLPVEQACQQLPEFKKGQGKASGGSMFVRNDIFNKIGGFDDEIFTEYSVEDQFFFDKLSIAGNMGFCDNPPIEMGHLFHEPSFNRTTKEFDFRALDALHAMSTAHKWKFINDKAAHYQQFLGGAEPVMHVPPPIPPPRKQVRIIDNQFAHGASFGTGDLRIAPKNFDWYRGEDNLHDVVVITDNMLKRVEGVRAKIKIALLIEPPSISPHIYTRMSKRDVYNKFDYILTYNKSLCALSPKFVWYAFGGCWIHNDDKALHEKTKNCSIIASDKRETDNHRLRHDVVAKLRDRIQGVYGRGYHRVENKIEALRDYRYSIVIENDSNPIMFSEKLIDCFVTGTIPLFYGGAGIEEYFNPDGIIICRTMADFETALNMIHTEGEAYYNNRKAVLEENFNKALQYAIPEDYIWEKLLKRLIVK